MKFKSSLIAICCCLLTNASYSQSLKTEKVKAYFESKEFIIEKIEGIGFEKGVTCRDNSDIIKVGKKYYMDYTKVFGRSPGYWGTIWAAVSEDEGRCWKELGEVLGVGTKGEWDSHATLTPNIIKDKGTYYMYYMAVQATPGNAKGGFENNSTNDYTAIGVAKSKNLKGPFVRCEGNRVISVSKDHSIFDSYRVDDAVLLKRTKSFGSIIRGESIPMD